MRIVVVGGGASGMMAAISAAEEGAFVTLLEKNEKLGKKIYITGKGRCNVLNLCEKEKFFENVVTNPKFLYSPIYKLPPAKLYEMFESWGLKLNLERGNRVFPASNKASDVTNTLEGKMRQLGVEIVLQCEVKSIKKIESGFLISTNDKTYECDRVIIATGGVSYPVTGSTGDGVRFAKSFGLKTVEWKPALCALNTIEDVSSLEGLSLLNVELSAVHQRKTIGKFFGEMLFTKKGLSGPIALSLSSLINRLSGVELYLDLKPALDNSTLDNRLLREFSDKNRKVLKSVLRSLMPARLVDYVANHAGISPEKSTSEITKEERKKLLEALKKLKFTLKELAPFTEAIVSSGGVSVAEIKPTMEA
ncbi:MAG: aminoacetone oxidase family FAD-binding enzyme, partial [Clostridiales bacterium]|nr:aminoacetone oxidase family FAD-binding enzyme [Clostridiales bacterium]